MSKWLNEEVTEWVSDWKKQVSEWLSDWLSDWVSDWMSKWQNEWVTEWPSEGQKKSQGSIANICASIHVLGALSRLSGMNTKIISTAYMNRNVYMHLLQVKQVLGVHWIVIICLYCLFDDIHSHFLFVFMAVYLLFWSSIYFLYLSYLLCHLLTKF